VPLPFLDAGIFLLQKSASRSAANDSLLAVAHRPEFCSPSSWPGPACRLAARSAAAAPGSAYGLTSMAYPITMVAATFLFAERYGWKVWAGAGLITLGHFCCLDRRWRTSTRRRSRLTPRSGDLRLWPIAPAVGLSIVAAAACNAQTDLPMLLTPWQENDRLSTESSLLVSPGARSGVRLEFHAGGAVPVRPERSPVTHPWAGPLRSVAGSQQRRRRPAPGFLYRRGQSIGGPWQPLVHVRHGRGWSGQYRPLGNGRGWYAKAALGAGRELEDSTLLMWLDYDGNRTLLRRYPSLLCCCDSTRLRS